MQEMYEVNLANKKKEFYAACDRSGTYIVIEALGFEFELGDQLICQDENIFNLTQKCGTGSIIQCVTSRKGAINFLKEI